MANYCAKALLLGVLLGSLRPLRAVGDGDDERPGHLWESAWGGCDLPEPPRDDPWDNDHNPEATHPVLPTNAPQTTYEDLVEYMTTAWGDDGTNQQPPCAPESLAAGNLDPHLPNSNNLATSSSSGTTLAAVDNLGQHPSAPYTQWDEELSTSLQQDEVEGWIADLTSAQRLNRNRYPHHSASPR